MVEALLLCGLLVAGAVVLPLLMLKTLIGVGVGLLTLPFKIVGGLFKVVFGVFGAVLGAVVSVIGALGGLMFALLFLVLLPLLPLLFVGAVVWALVQLTRPRQAVTVVR